MLDPRLRFVQASAREGALARLERTGRFGLRVAHPDVVVSVFVLVEPRVRDEALSGAGLDVHTRAGDVLTGEIPLASVERLAALDGVRLVEASRPMSDELETSVVETGTSLLHHATPTALRGAGVLVGIVDSGIDWRHECFLDEGGRSRIHSLWDQNLQAVGSETPPSPFGYGVVYQATELDAVLGGRSPAGAVRHADPRGHGTHVAAIAAGSGVHQDGASSRTFAGVAPEARLVVVAARSTAGAIGDSASVLDGIRFILDEAERLGRPVVVNLSQGDNLGAHDGSSLVERGIDALLGGPGRVLVKSAGNDGTAGTHASGLLSPGDRHDVGLTVPAGDDSPDTIDLWYPAGDRLDVRISPPSGAPGALVEPGESARLLLDNGNSVFLESTLDHPANGLGHVYLQLEPGGRETVEQGRWTLSLHGSTVKDGRWHAWLERASVVPSFDEPFRDDSVTVSVPGTAREVITVTAYSDRGADGFGGRLDSSSLGPTRDGRLAPTIAAPGVGIVSARSGGGGVALTSRSGTSYAAPHVTGAVALLLQRQPDLTQADVIARLTASARADAHTGAVPNTAWGSGKLDVAAAAGLRPASRADSES